MEKRKHITPDEKLKRKLAEIEKMIKSVDVETGKELLERFLKERNFKLDTKHLAYLASLAGPTDNNIKLFFNLSEYNSQEIADIISYLSELYHSVSGDDLEIKSSGIYELTPENTLELV